MYKHLIQCLAHGKYLKIEIAMRRKSCYAKPSPLNVRHLKLKTSGAYLVQNKISTSPDLDPQFLQYCLSYYINFFSNLISLAVHIQHYNTHAFSHMISCHIRLPFILNL